MTRAHSLTDATTHELLSDSRRRHLLAVLVETGQANVDDLALQIAARERDAHPSRVSEEHHQRVTISLVHNHLPKLTEHDVVQYDSETRTVVLMDVIGDFERTSRQTGSGSLFRKLLPGY